MSKGSNRTLRLHSVCLLRYCAAFQTPARAIQPLPSTPMNLTSPAPSVASSVHFGHQGRVCIVTGGAQGIGEACVRRFAAEGAKPVIVDVDDARGNTLAQALGVLYVRCDVGDKAQVDALVAQVLAAYGRIDVLVNNAGIMPLAPLAKLKVDEWSRMIDVNIKGVLHGIAAVLPTMTTQGDGHIINVASVAGHKLFTPIGTVYSATKFAVRVLSEGLRSEAPAGVRATIISPGAVESELQLGSSDADDAAGVKAFYQANQIPADSVARAIAYAIEQPADVDINEIVLRPTVQEF